MWSVVSLFTLSFMSLSRERESLLTREIEDLRSKLMTKTDELNKAINRNSEVCVLPAAGELSGNSIAGHLPRISDSSSIALMVNWYSL